MHYDTKIDSKVNMFLYVQYLPFSFSDIYKVYTIYIYIGWKCKCDLKKKKKKLNNKINKYPI